MKHKLLAVCSPWLLAACQMFAAGPTVSCTAAVSQQVCQVATSSFQALIALNIPITVASKSETENEAKRLRKLYNDKLDLASKTHSLTASSFNSWESMPAMFDTDLVFATPEHMCPSRVMIADILFRKVEQTKDGKFLTLDQPDDAAAYAIAMYVHGYLTGCTLGMAMETTKYQEIFEKTQPKR